jgi:hypothetical protein
MTTVREWIKSVDTNSTMHIKIYISYQDGHNIIWVAPKEAATDVRLIPLLDCEVIHFDPYNIDILAHNKKTPTHTYLFEYQEQIYSANGHTFYNACMNAGFNPNKCKRV